MGRWLGCRSVIGFGEKNKPGTGFGPTPVVPPPFPKRAGLHLESEYVGPLIMLGVGAASLQSCFAVLAPGLFPQEITKTAGPCTRLFEAALSSLALIFCLVRSWNCCARGPHGDAIKALLDLAPKTAGGSMQMDQSMTLRGKNISGKG